MLQTKGKDIALCFNLSHTSEQALYAISWGRDVGIDIERMPSSLDHDQIANSLFAAEERALLAGLPASQRAGIFLRLLACKEAYIKACGLGLSLALDRFAISIDADQSARLLYGHDRAGTLHPDLRELASSQGHAAALAVRGCDWHLKCWHFHDVGKEEPWSIWRDQLDS
jgi:4'-phosphopantetheinyl transferase